MKKIFLYFSFIAVMATLMASCESRYKLAQSLAGSWAGAPERLLDTDASSATIIETVTFTPAVAGADAVDSLKNGGTIAVSSLMSVTGAITGAEGITQPVSLTASGYASITGTWQVTGGNKVEVKLDPSSLMVKVDPDAVIVSTDVFSTTDEASLTKLRPQLAASISEQLRRAVADRYSHLSQLDDVNVKDNVLKFKVNKLSMTMSRQPE